MLSRWCVFMPELAIISKLTKTICTEIITTSRMSLSTEFNIFTELMLTNFRIMQFLAFVSKFAESKLVETAKVCWSCHIKIYV